MAKTGKVLAATSPIDSRIHTVRGQRVMLDSDLAEVYQVTTSQLNQAVARNPNRFPGTFSFQLARDEWDNLKSQIVISSSGHGGRRHPPRVFTEHGAVMLAAVLNSARAVQASICIADAFVRLRHVLDANRELARKVDELAAQVGDHSKAITIIFQELEKLTRGLAPESPRERLGFRTNKERGVTAKARK